MIEQLMYQGQQYGEPEYTATNTATRQAGTALRKHLNPFLCPCPGPLAHSLCPLGTG